MWTHSHPDLPRWIVPLLFFFGATKSLPLCAQPQSFPTLSDYPEAKTADSLARTGQNKAALTFLLRAKDSLSLAADLDPLRNAAVLRSLGAFYFENRLSFDTARLYLETAARLLLQHDPARKAELAGIYHLVGRSHYINSNPNKARVFFEKSLPLWLESVGENDLRTARCYNALAVCYNHSGNFEKSIAFGQKALRSLKKATSPDDPEIGTYAYNIGLTLFSKGDLAEALPYFEQALHILAERRGEAEGTARCLSLLGSTHASLGNGPKAVEYQTRALDMFRRTLDSTNGNFLSCYMALGKAYSVNRQLTEALYFYKKALFFNTPEGKTPPPRPDARISLATTYRNLHRTEEALSEVEIALKQLGYAVPMRLDSLKHRAYTYRALLIKSALLANEYRRDADPAHLSAASQSLTDAKTVILARIGEFYQEKNKLVFYQQAVEGNTQAIGIYAQLFEVTGDPAWLRPAFEYSEISKSLLLYQSVLENKARRKLSVPDSLAFGEESLRRDIAVAEKNLFDLTAQNAPAAQTDPVQEQIFVLKNRYEKCRREIEILCPDYFSAAATFPGETLESVQSLLPDDSTALLEYFTADTFLCIFLLRRDTFFFKKVPLAFPLEPQVRSWRASICDYFTAAEKSPETYLENARRFAETGHALYRLLLGPVADRLPRKLMIIPDGALGYLPFEALPESLPNRPDRFHQLPYLVRKHEISYCYSAALLREMQAPRDEDPAPETQLAMAPFDRSAGADTLSTSDFDMASTSDRSLGPLPHSGREAEQVADFSEGLFLSGMAATKAEFVRLAGRFARLHLATHARANDRAGEYSFLAFSKKDRVGEYEPLYVSEIYKLRLRADLVTLSACETGLGQLHRGEGIISLARAFTAAGARSVVPTLWMVNDAKTRAFMGFFYQNLHDGMPPAAALREAKLMFLKKFRGEEASPFFWSAFILVSGF